MSDLQAIESVVNLYFKGLHEGLIDHLQQAFAPHAQISGYYEGELVMIKLPEYLTIIRRMSAPIMLGEDYDMHITALHIAGNIACVETRYLFQALNYVDYLSLMQLDGEWRIIQKTFHHD